VAHLRRSGFSSRNVLPALAHWANVWRASGAWEKSARDGPRPLHSEAQASERPSEAHDKPALRAKRFPARLKPGFYFGDPSVCRTYGAPDYFCNVLSVLTQWANVWRACGAGWDFLHQDAPVIYAS